MNTLEPPRIPSSPMLNFLLLSMVRTCFLQIHGGCCPTRLAADVMLSRSLNPNIVSGVAVQVIGTPDTPTSGPVSGAFTYTLDGGPDQSGFAGGPRAPGTVLISLQNLPNTDHTLGTYTSLLYIPQVSVAEMAV